MSVPSSASINSTKSLSVKGGATPEVQEEGGTEVPFPRQRGGWASHDESRRNTQTEEEDERLMVKESDKDIPVIPDLEDIMEEDMTTQMAAPPSISVTRVTTYKQLNSDLSKHAGLFTLDGEIDLKILAKVLSPESEIVEEDKTWEWDKLFAELSPDIQKVWDNMGSGVGGAGSGGSTSTVKSMSNDSLGIIQIPGRAI